MKHILVNFNFTPDWVKDKDYLIYDRSDSKDYLKDFDQSRIIYTDNFGQVDFDKLRYLVDNYDNLPDVFLWGKTNLFKYVDEAEYEKTANNKVFTPLLKQDHKVYSDQIGPVCYYQDGMYYERNNSWYASQFQYKYCKTYPEFASMFHLECPYYIPFAPGGNYILTKEVVHRYSRDFYANMASVLPYCQLPVEAQFAERSYFNIWK